ncbi:MAG TPA: hypothetical protein VFC78_21200 [Tepidisphaeraceae bacterium]|nr:hypothetical protein [Tepidisphaeraceae bacterium]
MPDATEINPSTLAGYRPMERFLAERGVDLIEDGRLRCKVCGFTWDRPTDRAKSRSRRLARWLCPGGCTKVFIAGRNATTTRT